MTDTYSQDLAEAIEDLKRWKANRARKRLNNSSLDKAIHVMEEAARRDDREVSNGYPGYSRIGDER